MPSVAATTKPHLSLLGMFYSVANGISTTSEDLPTRRAALDFMEEFEERMKNAPRDEHDATPPTDT